MENYPWQDEAVERYTGEGIIAAVTGAGKTRPAMQIARRLGGPTLVTAASKDTLKQWHSLENADFMTFQKIIRGPIKKRYRLLIVDDAHRATAPQFRKVFEHVQYDYKVCLTATPDEECVDVCGPVYIRVGYDEANVAPFTVVFHGVELSPGERDTYDELTRKMAGVMNPRTKKQERLRDNLIRKRRDLVYHAEARIPYAEDLVRGEYARGRKILVICQRVDQANMLSERLGDIPHVVYHSKRMDDLKRYRDGDVRVAISVGMLREGFNDPETDVGILVSTALSETFNKQAIGRVIRFMPGKDADIHIILANDTTDTEVVRHADYDTHLVNIRGVTPPPRPQRRVPVQHDYVPELQELVEMKQRQGLQPDIMFVPHENGVIYAAVGLLLLAGVLGLVYRKRRLIV